MPVCASTATRAEGCSAGWHSSSQWGEDGEDGGGGGSGGRGHGRDEIDEILKRTTAIEKLLIMLLMLNGASRYQVQYYTNIPASSFTGFPHRLYPIFNTGRSVMTNATFTAGMSGPSGASDVDDGAFDVDGADQAL